MRPIKNMSEIVVVGGGLGGLTAARHAARLGRHVTLFENSGLYGGQVATIDQVEGLSVPGKFSGQDMAIHLLEDARKRGVTIVESGINKLEVDGKLRVVDDEQRTYNAEAIIIASGASLRKLGVPGESEFTGRGVSHCATCDGGFYRDMDVVVIGGGDSAAQEALTLVKTARQVTVVCRSVMKAKRDYIDRLASRENVKFICGSEVTAIVGNGKVSGIELRDLKTGNKSQVACAGVFAFVGTTPNSGYVPAALRDSDGRIKTEKGLATADGRIFAIGAARRGYGGEIAEAISDGIGAAEAACRLIKRH